ncbi:MAG: TA system VapC family ribonuclease toxin [Acidimicrobiales bacterium]
MSATVDANVLVHASDSSSPFHTRALGLLGQLAMGPEPVYVFWPVAMAYLQIVTDEAVFDHPLTRQQAKENLEDLLGNPNVLAVGEEDAFWEAYGPTAAHVFLQGDFVALGYLVGLMRQHGVSTIWTHDRDFRQYPGIVVRNPYEDLTPAGSRPAAG